MSPIAELPVDLLVVIIGYLTLGEASRFLRSMKRGDRLWQNEAVCKCLASSNNVALDIKPYGLSWKRYMRYTFEQTSVGQIEAELKAKTITKYRVPSCHGVADPITGELYFPWTPSKSQELPPMDATVQVRTPLGTVALGLAKDAVIPSGLVELKQTALQLRKFFKRVNNKNRSLAALLLSDKTIEVLIQRYVMFLNLYQFQPTDASSFTLIPTPDIELVWICHLLKPSKYKSYTYSHLGYCLDHDPSYMRTCLKIFSHKLDFDKTSQLWRDVYGTNFEDATASLDQFRAVFDWSIPLTPKDITANLVFFKVPLSPDLIEFEPESIGHLFVSPQSTTTVDLERIKKLNSSCVDLALEEYVKFLIDASVALRNFKKKSSGWQTLSPPSSRQTPPQVDVPMNLSPRLSAILDDPIPPTTVRSPQFRKATIHAVVGSANSPQEVIPILKKQYSSNNRVASIKIVPNYLADWIWHAHLMHPWKYNVDCFQYVGFFMDHVV